MLWFLKNNVMKFNNLDFLSICQRQQKRLEKSNGQSRSKVILFLHGSLSFKTLSHPIWIPIPAEQSLLKLISRFPFMLPDIISRTAYAVKNLKKSECVFRLMDFPEFTTNQESKHEFQLIISKIRNSHQWCSMKKDVLRNFTKFTGKHLCQSLFFKRQACNFI